MDTISYTAVRAKLAEAMDKVNDDHRPVIITRQRGKPAVLISLDDFNSYVETDYRLLFTRPRRRIEFKPVYSSKRQRLTALPILACASSPCRYSSRFYFRRGGHGWVPVPLLSPDLLPYYCQTPAGTPDRA